MRAERQPVENDSRRDNGVLSPPRVVVTGAESTSLDAVPRPRKLSAASSWTESTQLSKDDIPALHEHGSTHSLPTEYNGKTRSSKFPGFPEPVEDIKNGQSSHTPGSLQKPAPSDDEISLYTTLDRGYRAAEQKFARKVKPTEIDTSGLFTGFGAQYGQTASLDSLIRARGTLQPYGGDDDSSEDVWLPFDKLFELVNESSVYQELSQALPDLPTHSLQEYTQKICGPIVHDDVIDREPTSSLRSIFAILALMNKIQIITQFLDVDAGIKDQDLPLGRRPNSITGLPEIYSKQHPTGPCLDVSKWEGIHLDSFLNYQRYMLSPFLELRSMNSKTVHFYDLSNNTLLPFIEDHESTRWKVGHHGTVWRVKIHPAHHDFKTHDDNHNPYFAVKALNTEDGEGKGFKAEVSAWAKSVGGTGHPHLIQLLATWRKKGRWYLLFPWADNGNLLDYWKKPEKPEPCPSLVIWISKQCLGLAEGLRKIHRIGSDDPNKQYHDWGIHGDIKPENVLLFDDPANSYGKLIICDFGFTRFHGKDTVSNAKPAGYTGTYRAPEFDLKNFISRAYDMWSLGCLYLEFITWYLIGHSAVDQFSSQRSQEDEGDDIRMDKFFICTRKDEQRGAKVKPCVLKWILFLRTHENCSQYFHEFLDLIESEMLVINTERRKDAAVRQKCDRIVARLRRMHESTTKKDGYAFLGRPRAINQTDTAIDNSFVFFPQRPMEPRGIEFAESPLRSMLREESTFMVKSSSSGNRSRSRLHNNIDETMARNPGFQTSPVAEQKSQSRPLSNISGRLLATRPAGEEAETTDDLSEPDEQTPLLSTPGGVEERTYEARGMTMSPTSSKKSASISDFQTSRNGSNGHVYSKNTETEADEFGSMLAEYSANELTDDDSRPAENTESFPASEHEPTEDSRERRPTWHQAAAEMIRNITRWVKNWFVRVCGWG